MSNATVSGMWLGWLLILAGAIAVAVWAKNKSDEVKALTKALDAAKRNFSSERSEFEAHKAQIQAEVQAREQRVIAVHEAFKQGILPGRRWLAKLIAESDRAIDASIENELRTKKHPAKKAADEVAAASADRRYFKERANFLEYQLLSLKEYYPLLEEYEEALLDECIPRPGSDGQSISLDNVDPVRKFLSAAEYANLPESARNQLALDRYLGGALTSAAIGRLYERYIGWRWEQDGFDVEYHGIMKGYEDLGRDLICIKGDDIEIIQCKCWSRDKTIHEKHILQLFATVCLYRFERRTQNQRSAKIRGVFVTSATLSPVALEAAKLLKIDVFAGMELDKSFPMIKCNVNRTIGTKIYHLPFDQQYDRTKVNEDGEYLVATTAQAENLGFRRAYRFIQ